MSNVLEYILNLKDGITDKITKISSASEKTTSKMQKLEKQTLDNQKAFDKAGKSADGYRGKLSAMVSAIPGADVLMNPYVIATAAIIGAGKAGMSFDEGMAKINTTAQLTAPQLEQLKDNIIETGMAANANDLYALPEAYEKIISQTGDVIQSQDILKESIIGSKAGFTDQSIVADAFSTIAVINRKRKRNSQRGIRYILCSKKSWSG